MYLQHMIFSQSTLQGTNISHLGKRKIMFNSGLGEDMLVPRRVLLPGIFVSNGQNPIKKPSVHEFNV